MMEHVEKPKGGESESTDKSSNRKKTVEGKTVGIIFHDVRPSAGKWIAGTLLTCGLGILATNFFVYMDSPTVTNKLVVWVGIGLTVVLWGCIGEVLRYLNTPAPKMEQSGSPPAFLPVPPPPTPAQATTGEMATTSTQPQTATSGGQRFSVVARIHLRAPQQGLFTLGTNQFHLILDADGDSEPWEPLRSDGPPGFVMFAKNGVLCLRAMVVSPPIAIPISGNEIMTLPDTWDFNQDRYAMEIVDNTGEPVLQAEYKSATVLNIHGKFLMNKNGQYMVVGDTAATLTSDIGALGSLKLKALFLYPSEKYPGQRVPE
jgi:hypothetical protein